MWHQTRFNWPIFLVSCFLNALLPLGLIGCGESESTAESESQEPQDSDSPASSGNVEAGSSYSYTEDMLAEGVDVKAYSDRFKRVFSPDNKRIAVLTQPNGPYKPGYIELDGVRLEHPIRPAGNYYQVAQFSPDSKRFAVLTYAPDTNDYQLYVDGKPGPVFNVVHANSILEAGIFSPDSKHYAYTISDDKYDGEVVLNGKVLQMPMRKGRVDTGSLAYSSDGRLFYEVFGTGAKERNSFAVMANDQEVARHTEASMSSKSFKFSADGKQFAYQVKTRGGSTYSVNGTLDKNRFRDLRGFTFSPDGKRYGYYADDDKHTYVIIDGVPSEPLPKAYDAMQSIIFSPDSKRVAYIVVQDRDGQTEQRIWPVVDGQDQPDLWHRGPGLAGGFCFSGDSKHFAYTDQHGLLLDGKRHGPKCKGCHFPGTFVGPDHRLLVFAGKSEVFAGGEGPSEKWQVFVNGKPGLAYNNVEWMQVSEDQTRVSFLAKDFKSKGRACIVVNGKEQERCDGMQGGMVVFATESSSFAYPARYHDGDYYVVDGRRFKVDHNGINIGLSPLGTHFYRQANNRWINNDKIDTNQQVLTWPPIFLEENTVQYMAIREGNLYRITKPLK